MNVEVATIKALRHELHAHPEPAFKELATRERVRKFLRPFSPDEMREIGETGLVASWKGEAEGPTVLFRAELDALPIQEDMDFAHNSKNEGFSHKCGHDGHAAILCGLAASLKEQPLKAGTLHLLFQPAEEIGEGAEKVKADPLWEELKPDHLFALHNYPGYPVGTVIVRPGTFTAAVRSLAVYLDGTSSHAGEPERGHSPTETVTRLLSRARKMTRNEPRKIGFRIVTPVCVKMGEPSYGISPGNAEVHFTLRAWEESSVKEAMVKLRKTAKEYFGKEHCRFERLQEFSPCRNGWAEATLVAEAGKEAGLEVIQPEEPFRWGEDFGVLSRTGNSALFCIGAGKDHPPLHSPDYDFPDELLSIGMDVFSRLLTKLKLR